MYKIHKPDHVYNPPWWRAAFTGKKNTANNEFK